MESELVSLINKLNSNKAAGPDSIGPRLLKLVAPVILSPLLHIFNLSFSTGAFPDRLKLAKVIPVFKQESCAIAKTTARCALYIGYSTIILLTPTFTTLCGFDSERI